MSTVSNAVSNVVNNSVPPSALSFPPLQAGLLAKYSNEFTIDSVPEIGVGEETFSRASAQTFADFEGLLKTAPSGVPARPGARFVENLADSPNDFTDASWTAAAGSSASSAQVLEFDGTFNGRVLQTVGIESGKTYRLTFKVKLNSGTLTNAEIAFFGNFPITVKLDITSLLTSEYQIFTTDISTANGTGNTTIQIRCDDEAEFSVEWAQFEEVTGQTNQNPSEFVNGTQFFPYENGNTVDANGVVTEARGDAIAESIREGQEDELASTNLCIESQDVADWDVNSSPTSTVSADNDTGPDGLSDMDKVTGTGTHAYAGRVQQITLANSTVTSVTVYMSNVDSTQSYVGVYNNTDAGWEGLVDVTWTGATPSEGGTSSGVSDVTFTESTLFSGLWKLTFNFTSGANSATDDTDMVIQPDRAATAKSINFGYVQVESSTYPTSYIKTEGATATRNATSSAYPVEGIARANDWWGIMILTEKASSPGGFVLGLYHDSNNFFDLRRDPNNYQIVKKVAGTANQVVLTTLSWNAGDTNILAWRLSSATGLKIWAKNVTQDSAIESVTPGAVNTTDLNSDILSNSLYFGDNDGNSSATQSRRYFRTFFSDAKDSVIEAKINELAAKVA